MKTTTRTVMALAALLWTGSAGAQDAGTAVTPAQDQLRDRDRLRDPTTHEGDAVPDRLREQARDRMHDALTERATLPANAPDVGSAEGLRERARLHEAEAVRAAERHAARTRAGEPGSGRSDWAGPKGPGGGTGSGSGECEHVREQQRAMEMHGGSMGGGGHGGMDGGGTDGGGTHHGGGR
jgi:hypothetical protein